MKLFLIAGEPSGDRLGAALMSGLKSLRQDIEFMGIGGPLMTAEGMQSLFPMQELSVMGLAEILPKLRSLQRRIAQTAEAITEAMPDALITIDSPDFCLRVAARVRIARPGLRTIHYVAPTVWAWRSGRAARMAPHVDHVLALFPFEPPYMRAAGMTCDFVGHPVVAEPRATMAEAAAFRETHMIGPEQPLLLCLPGSRAGTVRRMAPILGRAAAILARSQPGLRLALPTLPAIAPLIRDLVADWREAPLVLSDPAEKRAAFAAANLAVASSGSVSLDLALCGVPMVIAWTANPVTMFLLKRLVRSPTVTLVNLVSQIRAVPEFLGRQCRPELIAAELGALLSDHARRAAQQAAMALTMERLGSGGEAPGLRAARSVLASIARI